MAGWHRGGGHGRAGPGPAAQREEKGCGGEGGRWSWRDGGRRAAAAPTDQPVAGGRAGAAGSSGLDAASRASPRAISVDSPPRPPPPMGMGPMVGRGAPTAVPPQEGARATRSTWPVSPERPDMANPSAGSQPALRLHFVPGPRIACPSLEPLPGSSPGLVWGDRGPDRPGCGWSRGRGETGRRELGFSLCTVYSHFSNICTRGVRASTCAHHGWKTSGDRTVAPAAGSAHSLPGHCACGAAARRA